MAPFYPGANKPPIIRRREAAKDIPYFAGVPSPSIISIHRNHDVCIVGHLQNCRRYHFRLPPFVKSARSRSITAAVIPVGVKNRIAQRFDRGLAKDQRIVSRKVVADPQCFLVPPGGRTSCSFFLAAVDRIRCKFAPIRDEKGELRWIS
jgi:hypothetical protein